MGKTMTNNNKKALIRKPSPAAPMPGFDPEMLFVECARCGSPILWEKGRSTEILQGAGIDPLELDPHCLLVTDGCPRCSKEGVYHVQIFRVEPGYGRLSKERVHGHG